MHLFAKLLERVNEISLVFKKLVDLDNAINLFDNWGSGRICRRSCDLLLQPMEFIKGQRVVDRVQVLQLRESPL
jgi:hypothetical protein